MLLTRDAFREAVFARDKHKCIICGETANLDAHHIIERRLFNDGGYYIDNGATLCSEHHLKAESTELSCKEIREKIGIKTPVLPLHLYSDDEYDKWGNIILPNSQRIRGELFYDESVQKIIKPVLYLFTGKVKYPRTHHLPWSASISDDDRVIASMDKFIGQEVVVTEKMDGENSTLYRNELHARSLDYSPHPSRNRLKQLWAEICSSIPDGWRLVVENTYAAHSIHYKHLKSFAYLLSIWNEQNFCLSWSETKEWAELLEMEIPAILYEGIYNESAIRNAFSEKNPNGDLREGYVMRLTRQFSYGEFRTVVGKYVRKNHVQTHGHWMRSKIIPNVIGKN